MDISQELLIDTGLNMAGYILAALLTALLYSMISNRKKNETVADKEVLPNAEGKFTETVNVSREESEQSEELEYVQLGRMNVAPKGETAISGYNKVASNYTDRDKRSSSRRDRSEIIRVARQMIKAGASQEIIKSVLPVSDEELALLAYGKN